MIPIRIRENELLIPVKATPRGGTSCILPFESSDTVIKLKVACPPVDGKANQAILKLLSDLLGIAKSQLRIDSGEKSRYKTVAIRLGDQSHRCQQVLDALANAIQCDSERCFQRES